MSLNRKDYEVLFSKAQAIALSSRRQNKVLAVEIMRMAENVIGQQHWDRGLYVWASKQLTRADSEEPRACAPRT